jgi:heme o synthase
MKAIRANLSAYLALTKPGIIRGNLLTAAAGYLLAAKGEINIFLLTSLLVGIGLVIAAACVTNNVIDRNIDRKMKRTRTRAVASGLITAKAALMYASLLGIFGTLLLGFTTNLLTMGLGIFAFFAYVVLYSVAKRRSVHGTLVGTISGAMPPVAGYTAVTGRLDIAAGCLFLVMVYWQMAHFYSIAMFRLKDYQAASIPVLPAVRGMQVTKLQIIIYIVAFGLACGLLTVFGYTGYTYVFVMTAATIAWLHRGLIGFQATNDVRWARGMFSFSLAVLSIWCLTLALEPLLP